MAFYLNQTRINQLEAIYNKLGTDPSARSDYYSLLSSWGSSYGKLALGVVNNNTLSGRIANEFAEHVAIQAGKPYSASIELEISKSLLKKDFFVAQRSF